MAYQTIKPTLTLMDKKKWFLSLGYSTFIGRKKISERIVKKNLSRVDLEILDLVRIIGGQNA